MAFCWNIAQQLNSDNNDAGLTNSGDEIMPMAFPTESGDPKLCGGIWGFGVFDNGDEAKIKAAKTFIEFIAADPDQVKDSVLASTYFPVRASVGDIYADNAIMSEYPLPEVSETCLACIIWISNMLSPVCLLLAILVSRLTENVLKPRLIRK